MTGTAQSRSLMAWAGAPRFHCELAIKRTLFAVAAVFVTTACGDSGTLLTYSADPITAYVVDQETGAPIEGANVAAGWELEGGRSGIQTVGWFKFMEAVTDAEGKFSLPGWGPESKRARGRVFDGAPR